MNATGRRNAMIVYASLMALSILWASLILAAPWLMAERHYLASAVIYKGFSAVCHQSPERSFYFHGRPMGVCSRCASIYAGFIIGLLLYPFLRDLREDRFPPRWILIGAAVPTVIDFAGADRVIIRSGRRFLRDARPRFGVERLARRGGEP